MTIRMFAALATAAGVLAGIGGAHAAEVTLRVHHFLPPSSPAQAGFIEPWADRVRQQSDGRIEIQIFPAMQLGGRPPQLYDQVRDGVADIVWTLPSYTPGRFPTAEVFELPFMAASAEATSQAVQEFAEAHLGEEFADVHPLLFHAHAPGLIHVKGRTVETVEDMRGLKLRTPTRAATRLIEEMGATSIGMPAPGVPEALSRGVIDGTVFPFEVILPLRAHEMVDSHTVVPGLYTSVFLFAMNQAKYDSLPDDLKRVIDDNSGMAIAQEIGRVWDAAEEPGRKAAQERGNRMVVVEGEALEGFRQAGGPVIEEWVADADARGLDGEALLAEARALIAKYDTAQ